MMEWEELSSVQSEDDLKELKTWLFQENIRLKNERKELEDSRDRFIKERAQFRDEMNSLNHRMVLERKRLKEDNMFFDKKMQILQDGFRQLDLDRRKLEKDRLLLESEKKSQEFGQDFQGNDSEIAEILFRGVNSALGMKKRYRDLIKIFHPDNLCGDARMVQIINREYERKRLEQ